jgi:hypothetical protein
VCGAACGSPRKVELHYWKRFGTFAMVTVS